MKLIIIYQYILIRMPDIKTGLGMLVTVQRLPSMFKNLDWSSSIMHMRACEYIHPATHSDHVDAHKYEDKLGHSYIFVGDLN